MTPADGSCSPMTPGPAPLVPDLAIVLPGGRTLLALSHLETALPRRGFCGDAPWRATCWPLGQGRAGLALVEAPLVGTGHLRGPAGQDHAILSPRTIDVAPAALAEFVRHHGLNVREAFDFLSDSLSGSAQARAGDRDFAAGFLSLAAEAGGFVEILACPDTGGLFAQGWAMSLPPGRHRLARLDATLDLCEADVAAFGRDDIPPPGTGFCLFSRDWRGVDFDTLGCLFYEQGGTLKRLEVVRGSVVRLRDTDATEHVRHMLPRLDGSEQVMRTYRRICRPRYPGIDSLSETTLPIAAAFDAVFESPTGGFLAMGWLLDPLRRVDRVILKSTGGLYAPMQNGWNPVPRPDLNDGFRNDPRFARLLDPADVMHGFVAFAQGRTRQGTEEFYLELVLDDNTCLFRPLTITRLDGRELLPQILTSVPLHDPALDRIVTDTLAPFLAGLPARPLRPRAAHQPLPLSATPGDLTAIIPLARMDHLQPIMALLAGTPEADRLDLALIMSRGQAGQTVERLADLFAFYGLRGRLLLMADQADLCARIEAGLALAGGDRVLLWSPSALPATPDWLSVLERELDGLDGPGLISPTLIYEDGSIFYGGDGATVDDGSPMLGYPREWLIRGAPRSMPAGAAQFALIDRAALSKAGGFSGQLYSDAMVHRDLARRLHENGCGIWSSRSVDFWMLEDLNTVSDATMRLLERIDSALVGHNAATAVGGRP